MNEEDAPLTLEQICSVCALEREWIVVRVQEGLLPAARAADPEPEWRFTTAVISRVRRMRDIERTYDAAPELAALVGDMLEEMDALREQIRRAGLGRR